MTQKPLPDLLGPGRYPQLNACVNYGTDAWGLYARGYRRAAEILTDSVVRTNRDQDTLIYPVLFLWRHHIELQLKAIARSASHLLGRRWSAPGQHDLAQLFGEVRSLLTEAFKYAGQEAPGGDLERLKAVLKHFRSIDEQSFVFRYPENLDGADSLPGVSHINYENVTNYFTDLSELLDAADLAISVFRDWQQEMYSA